MRQILNWMRLLIYPAAIVLISWVGYQLLASVVSDK